MKASNMWFIWTGSDLNLESFLSSFFLTTLVNLLRRWCRWKPIAGSSANLVAFQSLTLHPQVHHLFSFALNCFMQPNQQMALLPIAMKDGKKRDLVQTVGLKDVRFYSGRDTINDFPINLQSRRTKTRRSSQAEPLLWLVAEVNRKKLCERSTSDPKVLKGQQLACFCQQPVEVQV